MKKLLFAALIGLAAASCGSPKQATKPIAQDDVEVAIPLSGPEYRSDSEYWRAVQSGTSTDVAMAKKVAMQNARQELAATVQHQLQAVIENYGQNAAAGGNTEHEALYEELARTVVNQQMNGVEIVGEKLYRQADGKYRSHVCLQMSKNAVVENAGNLLSDDERLKLEFDKEQFKKVFDQEMEAFSAERK